MTQRSTLFTRYTGLLLSVALLQAPFAEAAPKDATPATPASTIVGGRVDPLIEVSVDTLEISETNSSSLGVSWGNNVNPTTGFQAGVLNFAESTVPSLLETGKLTRDALAGTIQALITNNQARVLANPTLLTKSGFEANFLVGGEIPYPTVGQGGVSGVEFKKYGVSLKILPQLTPRHTVDAQINVGVSNPDPSVSIVINNISVPGISSREAGTKVEVTDGETVVIAGIKQSRRSKIINRVPVLGYIPIIGLLFRSTSDSVVQTSLVVFVTFRLVK